MEKFHRGERLAQVKRLKIKRKRYWGYGEPNIQARGRTHRKGLNEMDARHAGMVSQYPQACSCPNCGNKRDVEGRSIQEKCDLLIQRSIDSIENC